MTGQYITIVAHGVPTVDLSLCNLGVFGNVHTREIDVETTIEIQAGDTHTMQVEHIRGKYTYANVLAINLRQKTGEELSFVTLANSSSEAMTEVIIDTAGLPLSNYTLVLESYDENSDGIESTLKTDTIQIVIIFEEEVLDEEVVPDEEITELETIKVIYEGIK